MTVVAGDSSVKLRILALHGYLQNAESSIVSSLRFNSTTTPLNTTICMQMFRKRIGSMRKALKSRVEFVFMDAPYLAQAASVEDAVESAGSATGDGRSWWQWSDVEPGTRPSRAAMYSGWETSQIAISQALQQHGPVDGLLGFSQGATAAALYLAHVEAAAEGSEEEKGSDLPRFAVLIGGFMPLDGVHASVLRNAAPLQLKSFHVTGKKDELVSLGRSTELWHCFREDSRSVYAHPGAHMVPTCSGEFKQAMVAFLDEAKGETVAVSGG